MIEIEVADRQTVLEIDQQRLTEAVRWILDEESIDRAEISLAIVDDATIHDLNRRYLNHDYATDVLSFVLDREGGSLEGEVITSAETATSSAAEFGWSAADELLLYVIHGTLHLVGYLDETPGEKAEMRSRERECLARFGLEPRYESS